MASQNNEIQEENNSSVSKARAIWNMKTLNFFCELCIKEIEGGQRPGTHFTKIGWDNLIKNFRKSTGKIYTKVQLKNKWDSLKIDWKLWKQLIGKETSLGWNIQNGTIDASDEWWDKKVQIHPKAAKFRREGLQPELIEKLNRMFTNTITTGDHARIPTVGTIPSEFNNGVEDANLLESDSESHDSSTNKKPNSQQCDFGSKKRKLGRESEENRCAVKLSAQIDHLWAVIEKRSTPPTTIYGLPDCSIASVMKIVNSLPGLEMGSALHLFTTRLFLIKEKREIFMSFEDPEIKLKWLKFEQSEGI